MTPQQKLDRIIELLKENQDYWTYIANDAGVNRSFIEQLCNGRSKNPGYLNTIAVEDALFVVLRKKLEKLKKRYNSICAELDEIR